MFRKLLNLAVFLVGLAAVCWIGAGYMGSNPLAAAVTMLIGACYLAGGLELHRYTQATVTLTRAVADLAAAPLGPPAERRTRCRIAAGMRSMYGVRV